MDERKSERFQLMLEPSAIEKIDNWRFARRLGSRAEAIRRLIEAGLQTKAATEAGTSIAE